MDNGCWTCLHCGAVVDIPLDDPWHTEIAGRSGGPNVRLVIAGGREVHRCEVSQPAA